MKRVLIPLLLSLLPITSPAQPASAPDDTAVRNALQAAENGNATTGLTPGHPLSAWIQQAALRQRIDQLPATEAKAFLAAHGGTPAGEAFRDVWLAQLGKRKDWTTLLTDWQPRGDTALRCLHLQALAATSSSDSLWLPQAQTLWREAGKSLPLSCDPVFVALEQRNGLDDALRWARFDAAVQTGEPAIMRRAARGLPPTEASLANEYAAFVEAPHERAMQWPATARSQAVATAGLNALARKDPDAADARLPLLAQTLGLSEAQQAQVAYQIALWTVASYLPRSTERLAAVPDSAWDERLHEWQVREALARADWPAALSALQRMPDNQLNDSRWQWFMGRMLEKTGQKKAAQHWYQQAAKAPTFHGFLAADHLALPYALCPRQAPSITGTVRNHPGVQRALQLQRIGRPGWAMREWNTALEGFDDSQRQQAVALASADGWFDRAVFSLKGAQEMQLYDLRFPLHHDEAIRRHAAANGLDPAWVAAEIRAESTFNPNARSPANALGLMQVIPSTGQAVAKRIGLTDYAGERSLFDPDTNITIGTAYLRELKEKYGNKPYVVLAAYNAGPTPTGRWLSQRGDFDPDIWIETISYKETRDYVARVLAFSVIYDWRLNGKAVSLADRMEGKLGQPSRSFACPK